MGATKIERIILTNRYKNVARDVTKFKHFVNIHTQCTISISIFVHTYRTQPITNVNPEMKTNKTKTKPNFKKKAMKCF